MDIFPDKKHVDKVIKGNLLVKVVRAKELPKLDPGGGCDPYVCVEIPNKKGPPVSNQRFYSPQVYDCTFSRNMD